MAGNHYPLMIVIVGIWVVFQVTNILRFHLAPSSFATFEDVDFPHETYPRAPSSRRSAPVNKKSTAVSDSALGYLKSQLPPEYHSLILSSAKAAVQPLWSCRDSSNDEAPATLARSKVDKFMFVHVFKTAGSTMRQFFHDYATNCPSRSYATLTSCTALSLERANTDSWHPCVLKDGRKNGKYRNINMKPVSKGALETFDMLGGHFRLGLMEHLPKDPTKTHQRVTNHRHLVFVRNAALKYVSGKVYIKKGRTENLTADFIIRGLQKEVRHHKKYHSKYANYLLTPNQAHERKQKNWNYTQSTQVMMQNLVDFNVTIGVTDDMVSSINLLEAIMDPSGHVPDLFIGYGGRTGHETKIKKHNISPLASESILEIMKRDHPSTYNDLMEFVRYEQQVTDFAVTFQQLQLQALREQKGLK